MDMFFYLQCLLYLTNNSCVLYVPPFILGIRILDGPITDDLEAKALQFKSDIVDVYSASWGPRDDGRTMESPGRATQRAIETGVREVCK
jgi:hypothetical protein